MEKKKTLNKVYNGLQKRRRAIKIRAFLMAGLLLAINSFAWFTFVSNADNNLKADVVKWEVEFFDEDADISLMDIDLDNLYPGMNNYMKEITIRNRSDLGANFSYSIENVYIFGEEYEVADIASSLQNDLPFYVSFEAPSTIINANTSIPFRVRVGWDYEKTQTYCEVKSFYDYQSIWEYYTRSGETYNRIELTQAQYNTNTQPLYVECDDLDSYWGEKSVAYKQSHPNGSALTLKLKLVVTQREE